LDLPEGSIIHADEGYTDYDYEDLLLEEAGLHLKVPRKKNSKRPLLAWEEFFWQADSPVHRDGLQQADHFLPRGCYELLEALACVHAEQKALSD
jgi:hypothetical protein